MVVHFCGGAFAGAAPLLYRRFLELLAAEANAVVVATPYGTAFDHDMAAGEAVGKFDAAMSELERDGLAKDLPVVGVGHSLGARVTLLLALRDLARPRSGNVMISYNQRPLTEAIPVPLPPSPGESTRQVAEFVREGVTQVLQEDRVQQGLDAASRVAGAIPGIGDQISKNVGSRAAKLVSQVGPILGDIAIGTRSFSPTRGEIIERLRSKQDFPRSLVVQFANDGIDETPWLCTALDDAAALGDSGLGDAKVAGESGSDIEKRICDVKKLRLPGGHTSPVDLPEGIRSSDHELRTIRRLAYKIARFAGEEAVEEASDAEVMRRQLKDRLLRLTVGTNRGLSAVSASLRAKVAACVEDLEAVAPWAPGEAAWQGEPLRPSIFGNWRLLYANAPDVLSLTVIPLVDCGEIRQDIPQPPSARLADEPLEVLNSVELSPKGAALLGVLPPLADLLGARVTVRALAEPRANGGLAIRFVGGTVGPTDDQMPLPTLPLPELPSFRLTASGINLLTTYVDDEMRVARSPLGDLFVLLRVAAR